jgi:hypothetical protein
MRPSLNEIKNELQDHLNEHLSKLKLNKQLKQTVDSEINDITMQLTSSQLFLNNSKKRKLSELSVIFILKFLKYYLM